ncbi:MAG: hypothetical protein K2J67_01615 [Lachnospiraceae bacterium]|nr:hypothetical protein [Lachnospiraceae bacterium]
MAHLKSQYDYEMQIAKENGDLIEQERLRLEKEQKIEESYQKQIDNIREEYDLIIGMNDARKSTIDAQIAALQANGYGISKELLQQQMTLDEDSYKKTLEEINRISEKIPSLSGNARKEAEKELEAEKQKAWEYQQNLGELQKAINDIDLAKLERIGTMLESYGNNLEYIQDILSHSDFTLSDSEIGGLTTEGLASIAITFAQIANNQEEIDNLYAQIAEKRRQLADTNIEDGDSLTEEIDTLIQKAHDLEKANYDSGESIKTTVIDSLNSLSDALDENISKHKEALQAKKDLFDYNQKIAKQLKSIASLEKQLAALQGSDTEEARARIQKLQIQLEDEQQNLKDMEYDKYIQDQEELLDKVSDDFQDFITSVADMSVSDICAAMSTAVSDNLPAIGTAIEEAFTKSSKIGELATSIDGLNEMIENLNYSGNVSKNVDDNGDIHYRYTDENGNKVDITVNNSDKPGTVTGLTVNGENVPLPEKEIDRTEDSIDEATSALYTKGGSNTTGSRIRTGFITTGVIPDNIQALLDRKGAELAKKFKEKLLVSRINEIQRLDSSQTEQFQKLTEYLIPLNTMAETISSLSANLASVNHSSAATTTTIRNVDIHLDGSHVMDTDTFIQTLHNPRVLREVSSGISSQLGNVLSNKLGRF